MINNRGSSGERNEWLIWERQNPWSNRSCKDGLTWIWSIFDLSVCISTLIIASAFANDSSFVISLASLSLFPFFLINHSCTESILWLIVFAIDLKIWSITANCRTHSLFIWLFSNVRLFINFALIILLYIDTCKTIQIIEICFQITLFYCLTFSHCVTELSIVQSKRLQFNNFLQSVSTISAY